MLDASLFRVLVLFVVMALVAGAFVLLGSTALVTSWPCALAMMIAAAPWFIWNERCKRRRGSYHQ